MRGADSWSRVDFRILHGQELRLPGSGGGLLIATGWLSSQDFSGGSESTSGLPSFGSFAVRFRQARSFYFQSFRWTLIPVG
jgi:hypothetical protein